MIDYAAEVEASKARRAAKVAVVVAIEAAAMQRANMKWEAWVNDHTIAARKIKSKQRRELARKERYRNTHRDIINAKNKVDYPRRKANGKLQRDKAWRETNCKRMKILQANWREKHRKEIRARDRARYYKINHGGINEA